MPQAEDELEKFLERIEGVTCFTETMRVYAPTCHGTCLDEVETLKERLDRIFGGSTVYDAEGRFFDETVGKVETEPVKVIEVAHHCLRPKDAKNIVESIRDYSRGADQNFLAISQGNFYIASREALLASLERLRKEVGVQRPLF